MDTADVIARLGGASTVAKELKKKRTTVAMWAKRNVVPSTEDRVSLWRMARSSGIDWTPPGLNGLTFREADLAPPDKAA